MYHAVSVVDEVDNLREQCCPVLVIFYRILRAVRYGTFTRTLSHGRGPRQIEVAPPKCGRHIACITGAVHYPLSIHTVVASGAFLFTEVWGKRVGCALSTPLTGIVDIVVHDRRNLSLLPQCGLVRG